MNFPLRVVSSHPADAITIRNMTPGKGDGPANSFDTLRAAGGLCRDLRRHLVDGHCYVADARGMAIPDEAWSIALVEARGSVR